MKLRTVKVMDALKKLQLLGPAANLEPAEDVNLVGKHSPPPITPEALAGCIHHAATPKGRIPLLKTLLSSACEQNCAYCPFRMGRDFQRATFTPDELARLFLKIHQQGIAKGIFLSSAIVGGGPRTQDRILAAAEILRVNYKYRGYLHVKIMPGAEKDQIAAAMQWADRVSINLEAPNAQRLTQLAPQKQFSEQLFERLKWIHELRQTAPHAPSATTQFVVGAAGESDLELLNTTGHLYDQMGLARVYFSRFSPISDTPLENVSPTSHQREQRLYQASFLLRDYGFSVEEMPYDHEGNLPLNEDPKLVWAEQNLKDLPVELNTADRTQLLRIPGIGPLGAERILRARNQGKLRDLSTLHKLGVATQRAAPFIILNGLRPAHQLTLWPT
ncbi:MAG: radical SAM protein [Anaerolineae bacterium]|nr:radical SAM protein [Anaerolineae bacterium]